MALQGVSSRIQTPEAFESGLETVTTGLQSDTKAALDSIEAFKPADAPTGDIAPAGSFPDPATGISDLASADSKFVSLRSEVLNPDLNVNKELSAASPLVREFSTAISTTVEGVAANAGKSGEEVLGDAIISTQSSLDDLMKEASTLDPSTKEGQQRLAEIQLEFQQKSRQLQIMSQILADFQELMKEITRNI